MIPKTPNLLPFSFENKSGKDEFSSGYSFFKISFIT